MTSTVEKDTKFPRRPEHISQAISGSLDEKRTRPDPGPTVADIILAAHCKSIYGGWPCYLHARTASYRGRLDFVLLIGRFQYSLPATASHSGPYPARHTLV
jgi:hypothetical protein